MGNKKSMEHILREVGRAYELEVEFIGRPLTNREYITLFRQVAADKYDWQFTFRAINYKRNGGLL